MTWSAGYLKEVLEFQVKLFYVYLLGYAACRIICFYRLHVRFWQQMVNYSICLGSVNPCITVAGEEGTMSRGAMQASRSFSLRHSLEA